VELLFENFADIWKIRSKIILEGMEALATKTLYKILKLRREVELQENEALEKKLKIFGSFILPEHFDIEQDRLNHAKVERAIGELQKMNKFKTPRDKMVCIMNACKVIGLMLKETNKSSVGDGADMFFPTIVYVLIKGTPKDIKANVDFIKLYRHPQLLESEDEYFLTTMTSAIEFVSGMTEEDLNIQKEEFKELYGKFADKKDNEVDARIQKRIEKKEQNDYDEFENQSDISMMTTQSNAQLLGELEVMEVPIMGQSLLLTKGIQTDEIVQSEDAQSLSVPEKDKSQLGSNST
jgi:hypothetical protein